MYPKSVDLRSNINTVYNQSATPACVAHAMVNALDAMYDNAGKSKRFSRSHLWHWARFWFGYPGMNVGVTPVAMQKAVEFNGLMTEAECPWSKTNGFVYKGESGYRLVRSNLTEGVVEGIKRLLCLGIPVVWCMRVTPMFGAMAFYHDWKTSAEIPPDISQIMGEHAVCIVGYDDECRRFLVENSYGPDWGDGGFFGLPYDSIQALSESFWHFDITPIYPKPIKGFTLTSRLTSTEKIEFTDRISSVIKELLIAAYTSGGASELISECKRLGISDKHLESLVDWNRGVVRQFKQDNPSLDWDGFIWDQI